MAKNGLERKIHREEREPVWSSMREIVPRIIVEYKVIRREVLNPQIRYSDTESGCMVQLIS